MTRPSFPRRSWSGVVDGESLPPLHDHLDLERVVATAAATWPFFGGHIDADYARTVQGRKHVYMATGPILGMVDAYVMAWAGPEAFLAKRSMRMADSLYADDDIVIAGVVKRKWVDRERVAERPLVEIDVTITNAAGKPCVVASAVVQLFEP